MNMIVALIINALLANGIIEEYATFWDRFVFYAFYYVVFDIVPMKTANGMPNNGLIIYEMFRYGRRTDFNNEPFLPSTSEVEEEYQEDMEKIEEVKEQQKEQIEEEQKKSNISPAEEKQIKEEIEGDKRETQEYLEKVKDNKQKDLEKHEDNLPK